MKQLSKLLYLAATCALIVATFAFVGPRTVHAIVATLVRDVDNPARHPFQSRCFSGPQDLDPGTCVVAVVPAGQELVIQGVSVQALINPGNILAVDARLDTIAAGAISGYTFGMQNLGPIANFFGGHIEYTGFLPITVYADPGTSVDVVVGQESTFTFVQTEVSVSGYLVSLP
jgi:hypothetical protein